MSLSNIYKRPFYFIVAVISCFVANAQSLKELQFDKFYADSENQWVVLPLSQDSSIYKLGFVYLDMVAGYTFSQECDLQIDNNGNIISLTKRDNAKRIIYRLGNACKPVALLPQKLITKFGLKAEPEWLRIYQTPDLLLHDIACAKHLNAQGYYEKAIMLLEKHKQSKSQPENYLFELGFAYNALRQYEKAIAVLEPVVKDKSRAQLYKELGFAYLGKGDYKRAVKRYKTGIALAQNNQQSLKAEMAINLAMIYSQNLKNDNRFRHWGTKAKNWGAVSPLLNGNFGQKVRLPRNNGDTAYLDKSNNIVFNDKVLEKYIKKELNIAIETPVNVSDVERVTFLNISGSVKQSDQPKIKNLDALKYFKRLEILEARFQSIRSLKPLSGLCKLRRLQMQNNEVDNIAPLAELKQLEVLELYVNNVSDLSPLRNLTKLQKVDFFRNNISSIEPLEKLSELNDLNLGGNSISDISPLKNLRNLNVLWLYNNPIRNIGELSGLSESMESLSVAKCNIKDVTFLRDFQKLHTLVIFENPIRDLTPVSQLSNLQTLLANNCELRDLDVVVQLAKNNAFRSPKARFKYQLDLSNNQIDYNNAKNIDGLFYLKQVITKSNF